MSAISDLERMTEKLNEVITGIDQVLKQNPDLADYYGYSLNQAKELCGEAHCKIERAIENHGETWVGN